MLVAGGDYEACLILDKTIWRKENFPIKGEILVGIPSRDLLLITGSEDPTNINRLKSTIKDIYKTGSYPVSDKIFIYKNEQFELYE
jgi:uncharacterized protein YtpQ (UPF0354 family)